MNVYFLIILLIILLFTSIFLSKNIFAPSIIILLSYILSLLLVVPNIDSWKVNLHSLTFYIILFGLISFIVGYYTYMLFCKNKTKEKACFIRIDIPKFSVTFIVFFQLITVFLYYISVSKIVGQLNFSNFSAAMEKYRLMSAYSDELTTIPGYVVQMSKISNIIFYFVSYIFFNNYFYSKKHDLKIKKSELILFIFSFFAQALLSILAAGRYNIVCLIIGSVVMFTIVKIKENDNLNANFKVKDYLKILIVFAIVIILFSTMRTVVGRTNTSSFFDYISSYFGGSVPLLDRYLLNHPNFEHLAFGYNTFNSLYRLFYKFGLVSTYRLSNFEFMYSGTLFGNVYTSFLVIYSDFSFYGIVILLFIEGFIWAYFFKNVYIKCRNDKKYIFFCIIYCIHISSIFLHFFGENFFSKVFSQAFILEIFYISIIYHIIFKLKIYFKR